MDIKDFLIGIGLFSVVAVVILAAVVDMSENYADAGIEVVVDENASAVFDKASAINQQAENMQQTLTETPAGPVSAINAFIYGAWSTMISTFDSLSLATALVTEVGALFSLPPAITLFIVSSLVITLVVTIAYLVFRMGGGA